MPYQQTKQRLFELLRAGHRVSVHWDCGGDQSFVTTIIDEQEQEPEEYEQGDFAYDVDQLLTEELNLPDVGEFSMQGDGEFFLEDRGVGLVYTSRAEIYASGETDFYASFTDEELAELGLERPAPEAETQAVGTPGTEAASADDDWMGEEYSGRRILFELPAA